MKNKNLGLIIALIVSIILNIALLIGLFLISQIYGRDKADLLNQINKKNELIDSASANSLKDDDKANTEATDNPKFSKDGWNITFDMEDTWTVEDADVNPELEDEKIKVVVRKLDDEFTALVWISRIDNKGGLDFNKYCENRQAEDLCNRAIDISEVLGYDAYLIQIAGEGENTSYIVMTNESIYTLSARKVTGFLNDTVKETAFLMNQLSSEAVGSILRSLEILD